MFNHRNDYEDYAEICFKEFGDRVKYWITLNEPWTYSMGGYAAGLLAPGRCSDWQGLNCAGGDSGTEPYLAAHYQLLAHAKVVHLYKKKYQVQYITNSIRFLTSFKISFDREITYTYIRHINVFLLLSMISFSLKHYKKRHSITSFIYLFLF